MAVITKRLESWIYNIINPIITGLKDEIYLLENKNLTWRFYNKKAEYIFPIENYVGAMYANTYRHFLLEYPDYENLFNEHDNLLCKAEVMANELLDKFNRNAKFVDFVNSIVKDYPKDDFSKKNVNNLVIQHLINEVDFLPSHHGISEFWEKYRKEFYSFKDVSFHDFCIAKQNLAKFTKDLLDKIEYHSFEICKEYDIPADPL